MMIMIYNFYFVFQYCQGSMFLIWNCIIAIICLSCFMSLYTRYVSDTLDPIYFQDSYIVILDKYCIVSDVHIISDTQSRPVIFLFLVLQQNMLEVVECQVISNYAVIECDMQLIVLCIFRNFLLQVLSLHDGVDLLISFLIDKIYDLPRVLCY